MPVARTGYSLAQIALHWIIAVLIVVQVVLHEGMEAAYRAGQGGAPATESELFRSDLHVACGIAVLPARPAARCLAHPARRPAAAGRGARSPAPRRPGRPCRLLRRHSPDAGNRRPRLVRRRRGDGRGAWRRHAD